MNHNINFVTDLQSLNGIRVVVDILDLATGQFHDHVASFQARFVSGAILGGAARVSVNSLHGQGLEEPGEGIVIDGRADDSTPEAIYVEGAPGFTLSVQWHPEFNAPIDPVSQKFFGAFGDAVRDWAEKGSQPRLKSVS